MNSTQMQFSINPQTGMPVYNEEDLKKRRQKANGTLYKLSLLIIALSLLSIVFGSIALHFGLQGPAGFPFVVPGGVIIGVLMLAAGVMAFFAAKDGSTTTQVSTTAKCLIIGFFIVCVIDITFCIMSAGISVFAIVVCEMKEGELYTNCLPNVTENVTFAIINLLIGVLLASFAIAGSCFFCCYGRAYGFKSRVERMMEAQMRMMQMQQQLTSQGQTYGLEGQRQYNAGFKY